MGEKMKGEKMRKKSETKWKKKWKKTKAGVSVESPVPALWERQLTTGLRGNNISGSQM